MKISRKERTQRNHARPEDIDTYRTETDGIRISLALPPSRAFRTVRSRAAATCARSHSRHCCSAWSIEATRKKRPGAGRPACHSTVSGGESDKPLPQQDQVQSAHVTQNDEHCRQTHTDEHGQSGDWHGLTEQIHSATPTTCRKKYCCVKYRNEVTQQLTLSNLFTRKIQFYMIRNDCRIRHKNDIVCRFAWMVQCLNRLTPCMKKATWEPQNQVRKLRQLIKSRARTRRTDLLRQKRCGRYAKCRALNTCNTHVWNTCGALKT
jgi:hypothetical protein